MGMLMMRWLIMPKVVRASHGAFVNINIQLKFIDLNIKLDLSIMTSSYTIIVWCLVSVTVLYRLL